MIKPITKENTVRMLEIFCGVLACCFLGFKLYSYDHYQLLLEEWTKAHTWHWNAAVIALVLLCPNLLLEAAKWKTLLSPLGKRSFLDACKDVCKGSVGAFITPNRVGEFPYRAMFLPSAWRVSAVALGVVGSLTQMMLISIVGIPSLSILSRLLPSFEWGNTIIRVLVLMILMCIACVGVACLNSTQRLWREFIMALQSLGYYGAVKVLIFTLGRYLVFSAQFWLMLEFCGVSLSLMQALLAIPAYYFLVTFTPSVNVAELAVRGSWAVIALSPFTDNTPAVILTASLVWVVNGLFPLLIGLFLRKTNPAIDD